jgi:hypothetical protein
MLGVGKVYEAAHIESSDAGATFNDRRFVMYEIEALRTAQRLSWSYRAVF